ncbi:hydroxyacylglutathione hydrolase [Neptunomonas antarctica]|uniref:Hydroxyacylglutathione hydrolase n=1 Tax=Neptunomonas antarctica TaxID=619304 RepID=A0A1N7LS86_9GAMM|nr:hydroxyacylglutathione hydrolase [Neptunomonas antarctica]SIS76715.1 hydroxyacylglutathione hydrolase [Neptunomonas antarctica]
MFTVTPLPAFSDNYIWMLTKSNASGMIVVDPGDADVVIKAIDTYQQPLKAILLTHHHPDHTGGVKELVDRYNIPVYGPKNSPFTGISYPLGDSDQIDILGEQLIIKEIPGHTLDHISYYLKASQPQIFCGDTLFLAGCGRLFEGTPEQMLQSMSYFKTLPANTAVYCTHEYSLANLNFAQAVEPNNPDIQATIEQCKALRAQNLPTLPTRLSQELTINPFMRSQCEDVRKAAEMHTGKAMMSELETFTAIREWKNVF